MPLGDSWIPRASAAASHVAPYISVGLNAGLASRSRSVVPFAVALEGFRSSSRRWSLLALIGLTQLTSIGCVREVNLMPDGDTNQSTDTQEKGPEAGPGDTQTPTSGVVTSVPGTEGTGAADSASTSSSTGDADSGASSDVTEEEDTGDPDAACVKDGEDRQCVPKAPPGWFGPVGLLQASKEADIRVCKAYSEDIEKLGDEVNAPPPECRGCEPRLLYPDSLRAQAVEYNDASCSEASEVARAPMGEWFCRKLVTDGDGKKSHWKMLLPEPEGELSCAGGGEKKNITPAKFKNVYRGCKVERKGSCESEEQVCAKKGVGPTCVYRLGDMKCPSDYSARRQVLFAGVEDSRSCGKCEGVMKKQGSWSYQGKLSVYRMTNCISSSKVRSFDVSELSARCDSEETREKKEWNHARLELTQPKFDGVCEVKGWKAEGEAKGKDPVTVCCRGIEDEL